MSLLYLETFHGTSATEATVTDQLKTQQFVVPLNSTYTANGIQGRFPDTIAIAGDPAHDNIWPLLGKWVDLSPASTYRCAFDFKSVGFSTSFNAPLMSVGINPYTGGALNFSGDAGNSASEFFCIAWQGSTSNIIVRKGSTVLATSSFSHTATELGSAFFRMEVEFNIVAQTIRVWVDDILEIDASSIAFNQPAGNIKVFTFGGATSATSTIAIWDDQGTTGFTGVLGDFKPVRLLPNADGSTQNSTVTGAANRFEAVDDPGFHNITDYVTLSNDGDRDLYQYEDLDVEDSGDIITVVCQPAAWRTGLGSALIKGVAKSGLSETVSAAQNPLIVQSGSYGQRTNTFTFDVDPDTGVAWDATGIASAEFGIEGQVDLPA